MKRTRDRKPVTNLLGKAYPTGADSVSRRKRLLQYALESLLVPVGVVLLELYLDFYQSWDTDTYVIHVPRLLISFAVAYAVYFVFTWLTTERRIRKYVQWKEETFHGGE